MLLYQSDIFPDRHFKCNTYLNILFKTKHSSHSFDLLKMTSVEVIYLEFSKSSKLPLSFNFESTFYTRQVKRLLQASAKQNRHELYFSNF